MDISVLIALGCLHLQNGQVNPNHLNQFNPGIGVEYGKSTVGMYENSYRRISVFGVYSPFTGWFKPFAGVVTGYQGHLPVPIAAGVAIEPWKSGPMFTVTPADTKGGVVFGFGWKQSIGR